MKNGIDFFPLDTVLDNKFKLIEAEFGLEGFAVVVKLLQYIYGEGGYYGEVNDDVVLLFSRNIGLGGNTVTEIINGAIRRGIFNKELYDKYRILTSEGIQNRYFNIVKRRQNVKVIKEYLLGDYIQNLDNVNISQKNVNSSAQSKVKESKVKDIEGVPPSPASPVVPYGKIGELWNSICTAYPKIVKVTDKRKTKIRLRLEEFACDSEEETLAAVEALFRRVQASSFLRGDNNRGWQASFDWLFENGSNWVKVTEGNYDNRGGYHPAPAAGDGAPVTARLGIGEYIDPTGRRTYGTGQATIPADAPARPSERHYWNSSTKQWALL